MKKLILSLIIALITNIAGAQITMTSSGDTVTNTATKTVSLKVTGSYNTTAIQAKVVKISGTVAGTITLQGSVDGSNYETVDSTTTFVNRNPVYTATNTATQTKTFILKYSPYLYYRLSYTGSGTMSARIYGYLLAK